MAFPSNLEELQAAGYVFHRTEPCLICKNNVEIFITPGKREISMDPMYLLTSPAVRHVLTCNTRPNPVDAPQAQSAPKPSPEPRQGAAGIDSIPIYGVSDHNHQLLSVGWRDGILVCQFKTAKWSYGPGVPEAEFVKLRRSSFAYRIFTCNIKGKFTATKLS
jgi:hypothetical protein